MTGKQPNVRRVHILNEFTWPDGAPTAMYAEFLADRLNDLGQEAIVVGGTGSYRAFQREKPRSPIRSLQGYRGRRGSHLSTFASYASIHQQFRTYIKYEVRSDDIVIVTSAPPFTITLHRAVKSVRAKGVYWLQDYYPDLFRGVWDYPDSIRSLLRTIWTNQLSKWDHVVKIGSNLGYDGANAVVLRNWPTLEFPNDVPFEEKTALYTGNLGYGHDVASFIASCEQLRSQGYKIFIRGDGPGISKLPPWMEVGPVFPSTFELKEALLKHEVHLIAAHPSIRTALFPSKIWNSLAAGRRIVCSGFEGEMHTELEVSRKSSFQSHLDQWVDFLSNL